MVKFEFTGLLLMALWMPWPKLFEAPLAAITIFCVAFFQSVAGFGSIIFLNKKDIRDLRDDTKLGYYTRNDLLMLVRQVLDQMGLKTPR